MGALTELLSKPEVQAMLRKSKGSSNPEESIGMKKGGKVSSASKRADGIATKGKTKGKIV